MTVCELFESASEAERTRRQLLDRIAARRAAAQFHGRSMQTMGHGVVLDPMRNVDECIDAESEDVAAVREAERELCGAWEIASGIAALASDDAAQVTCRHYLWLEEWPEIARATGHTESECRALLDMTMGWAEGVGIARLRDAGRGKPPLEIVPGGDEAK